MPMNQLGRPGSDTFPFQNSERTSTLADSPSAARAAAAAVAATAAVTAALDAAAAFFLRRSLRH